MNGRRAAAVVALGATIAAVVLVLAPDGRPPGHDGSQAPAKPETQRVAKGSPSGTPVPAAGESSKLAESRIPAAAVAAAASGSPVELQVDVPPDVGVGDVFQARVHIHANSGVRQLDFAIAYDKTRLTLVSASPGEFAQRPDGLTEFGAEEPSDGYIQVRLNVRGPSIPGAGELAIFRFQAIKPGRSPIVLQNLTLFDDTGFPATQVAVLHEGAVSIH